MARCAPAVTSIIYEANYGLRTIFSDGRSLPGPDAQPVWYGYLNGDFRAGPQGGRGRQ